MVNVGSAAEPRWESEAPGEPGWQRIDDSGQGFVARRKRGTSAIYRIADPGVHQICDGISAGIEAQLTAMEAALSG